MGINEPPSTRGSEQSRRHSTKPAWMPHSSSSIRDLTETSVQNDTDYNGRGITPLSADSYCDIDRQQQFRWREDCMRQVPAQVS